MLQLIVLQPLWLLGLDAAANRGRSRWRVVLTPFSNPLTIGALLGVVVAVTGVTLPAPVEAPLDLIAGIAIPGMLLAFGISLRRSPALGGGQGRELGLVLACKLLLMPAATLGAALLLGLGPTVALAATVMAVLPTGQSVYVLAVRYGRGVRLARDGVLLTTLLAIPAMVLAVELIG